MTKPICPRCENRRLVTSGHNLGTLPLWIACPACNANGPVACTDADHETPTRIQFLAKIKNRRDWPEAGIEIGECVHCFSTLAFEKPGCFEEYGGLSEDTAAELERIQAAVLMAGPV